MLEFGFILSFLLYCCLHSFLRSHISVSCLSAPFLLLSFFFLILHLMLLWSRWFLIASEVLCAFYSFNYLSSIGCFLFALLKLFCYYYFYSASVRCGYSLMSPTTAKQFFQTRLLHQRSPTPGARTGTGR